MGRKQRGNLLVKLDIGDKSLGDVAHGEIPGQIPAFVGVEVVVLRRAHRDDHALGGLRIFHGARQGQMGEGIRREGAAELRE
jgi:hypothetical protein